MAGDPGGKPAARYNQAGGSLPEIHAGHRVHNRLATVEASFDEGTRSVHGRRACNMHVVQALRQRRSASWTHCALPALAVQSGVH